jgi:hypothetical protein
LCTRGRYCAVGGLQGRGGHQAFPICRILRHFSMFLRFQTREIDLGSTRFGRAVVHPLHRRITAGAMLAAILLLAGQRAARASYCGSYVISNSVSHEQMHIGRRLPLGPTHKDRATGTVPSHSNGQVPHVPSPCERGFCKGPSHGPATPPSVPTVQPFDQVLYQLSATMPLQSDGRWHLLAGSVQPRSGFYRLLDRPPEPICF